MLPVRLGRRNKFGNSRATGYDSNKEFRRAKELELLQRAGVITDLEQQVSFELIPPQEGERSVSYVADFTYIEDGRYVVEDVKSDFTRTLPVYVIKRKLMQFIHGIKVKEV